MAVQERRRASASRGRPSVYNASSKITSTIVGGFPLLIITVLAVLMLAIAFLSAAILSSPSSLTMSVGPIFTCLLCALGPLYFLFIRRRIRLLHGRAKAANYLLCPSCMHPLGRPEDDITTCPECGSVGVASDIAAHWGAMTQVPGTLPENGTPKGPA